MEINNFNWLCFLGLHKWRMTDEPLFWECKRCGKRKHESYY